MNSQTFVNELSFMVVQIICCVSEHGAIAIKYLIISFYFLFFSSSGIRHLALISPRLYKLAGC